MKILKVEVLQTKQEKKMVSMKKPQRPTNLPITKRQSLKPTEQIILQNEDNNNKKTIIKNKTIISNCQFLTKDTITTTTTIDKDIIVGIKPEVAPIKHILPLLPRIYKPNILHNYQLINNSNNNNNNNNNNNELIDKTKLKNNNNNDSDNNNKRCTKIRKTASVLTKPQYACFQQQQIETETENRNTLIRTRSNDFIAKRNIYNSNNNNSLNTTTTITTNEHNNNNNNEIAAKRCHSFTTNVGIVDLNKKLFDQKDITTKTTTIATIKKPIRSYSQRYNNNNNNINNYNFSNNLSNRTPLTSTSDLPIASSALLSTRIPGNTLYYF